MMFVKTANDFEVESDYARVGYVHLIPKETMDKSQTYSKLPFLDGKTGNSMLNAKTYKSYFYDHVQKWLNENKDTFCKKLKNRGVAFQLNVFKDKKAMIRKAVWFYVNLVPAVEIGNFS